MNKTVYKLLSAAISLLSGGTAVGAHKLTGTWPGEEGT